jgi:predicted RNase H-like HicB family nuclease
MATQRSLKVTIKARVEVKIQLLLLKEEDSYVAYCPALELSSYGNTIKEAKSAFEDALAIFIEETTKMGTMKDVLLHLGWTLQLENYMPPSYSPVITSLIPQAELAGIENRSVQIPA